MLRSHIQRSVTPDITSQRRPRHPNWNNHTLNGLLSPSDSRGSLDRMTADSIDRRRIRKRASDKFNDTIRGVGQLFFGTLPPRSSSAIGNYSRDQDAWSTSSVQGNDPAEKLNGAYTTDKNGRVRKLHDRLDPPSPSPSIPPDWMPERDVTICSIGSSSNAESDPQPQDQTIQQSQVVRPNIVIPVIIKDSTQSQPSNAPTSALDIAMNEDHDSIMRLAKIREDQFTTKLISAMRELKNIAEVARIIDEVDDEEWLLVFIGELDHRLRYLMKTEEEECEHPDDHEANIREKATILDVALDLISFLKDRSAYRVHRRYSLVENIDGAPLNGSHINIEDGNTTIQRLRKMAAMKPHNPYEMQKWQRQLMNLAGTLDKYLNVLQKEKEVTSQPHHDDVIRKADRDEEERDRDYMDALSEFSTLSSGDDRLHSVAHTSSGASLGSNFESDKVRSKQRTPNPNSNANNNKNNSNHISTQPVWTLPVLDLRATPSANTILTHIGQAAHVQDVRGVCSPNSIDGERFLHPHPLENPRVVEDTLHPCYTPQPKDSRSLPASSRTSPTKAVVSAYCKMAADSRRRSASVSNDADLRKVKGRHKSEFRMSVGGVRGRGSQPSGVQLQSRRARSVDAQQKSPERSPPSTTPIGGARPKVRPTPRQTRRSDHSESSSSSDLEYPGIRHRLFTSSMSTQCDLDQGLRQREKNAEEKLKQMKRRADLLKTGLEEARQDRDEKERKISVLQARLDRMKKNLVTGESEKGAVEEEMDRLNKLLKEKTQESEEEISVLKRRLEELERQLRRERERYDRMNETVEDLQQQLMSSQTQCEQMAGGKRELEQRIHDLTVSLMHERQHSAQLQEDNTRLEYELEAANCRLVASSSENDTSLLELRERNCDLEEKLEHERHIADVTSELKAAAEERASKLESAIEEAGIKIDELEEENQRLSSEVEYLNHELKVNEERKQAQADQYDKEISRLLSEGAEQNPEEVAIAKEEAEREKKRADNLEKENEKLKNEREENERKKGTSTAGTSTEDKSVQAEDMSYTRMRAFDWYSSQAHHDALRLNERGRQLELETRIRIRAARDAMRQVNYSLMRERSSTMPKIIQPNNRGTQQKR